MSSERNATSGFIGCLTLIFLLVVALFIGKLVIETWDNWQSGICERSYVNFETRWDWGVGCQINDPEHGWIPARNWRTLD